MNKKDTKSLLENMAKEIENGSDHQISSFKIMCKEAANYYGPSFVECFLNRIERY